MAVDGLTALTGLQIAYRKSKQHNPLGITEIAIKVPFEKYGYFTPEALGRKCAVKTAADFKLQFLSIWDGSYYNTAAITFTFSGSEEPSRKMKIFLIVYDNEGKVIGRTEDVFVDPRVMAKE